MGKIIDSCIWIDYFRNGTPDIVRKMADREINDPEAMTCEAVQFELLAGVSKRDRSRLMLHLETMPMVGTPLNLWAEASKISILIHDTGMRISSMDLIIAATCILKKVSLVTFDQHFLEISKKTGLELIFLKRPR